MFTQCAKPGMRTHVLTDKRFDSRLIVMLCRIGHGRNLDQTGWEFSETTLVDWLADPNHCASCKRILGIRFWWRNREKLMRQIDEGQWLLDADPAYALNHPEE